MHEIRTDPVVVAQAISDAINEYMRELVDRGVVDREAWEAGSGVDGELLRLKHEVAASVAARWEVSWRRDDG
ncbi:MAG: hypothetical protein JNM56_04865 [Planctomycetia bacterium]|nr:hypothetical protein [Planctomycetia bacterium]